MNEEYKARCRREFVEALATYLTTDQAMKSIFHEMGKSEAKEWANLYQLSGCRGYATK